MEALSRREEQEIEAAAKSEALRKCDSFVKDFAECAQGRTFSTPFACAGPFKAMNECTKRELTQERIDALKLEYIARRAERAREAVELLTAERRAKLLRMAGKKDEAAEVDRQVEALRAAAAAKRDTA